MKRRDGLFSLRVLVHLLVLRPLLKLVFGINVQGREHLASLDQYIMAANHNSHLDILLLFSIIPAGHINRTRPVAAGDYFMKRPMLHRIANYLFRPIWIIRGDREADPLAEMRQLLQDGCNIIIFPEGTRGTPGRITRFKSGVGRLAECYAGIPTVPVLLSGPEKAFPKDSAFPLPIWNQVTIGPPQMCSTGSVDFTAALQRSIQELSESKQANRHRRKSKRRRALVVAVLGIDGSGKSTISERLAGRLSADRSVSLISDRLELYAGSVKKPLQPLPSEKVRQVLGRYAKSARSLKHYKVPKLAELLLRDHLMAEVQRWYSPAVLVLDGSPVMNLSAWAVLYRGELFDAEACSVAIRIVTGQGAGMSSGHPVFRKVPELAALRRLGLASLKLPSAVIWLDVDPAVAVQRITERGQKKQVHETEEKLCRLRSGYRMVCDVAERDFDVPVRILDGSRTLEQLTDDALDFLGSLPGRSTVGE